MSLKLCAWAANYLGSLQRISLKGLDDDFEWAWTIQQQKQNNKNRGGGGIAHKIKYIANCISIAAEFTAENLEMTQKPNRLAEFSITIRYRILWPGQMLIADNKIFKKKIKKKTAAVTTTSERWQRKINQIFPKDS